MVVVEADVVPEDSLVHRGEVVAELLDAVERDPVLQVEGLGLVCDDEAVEAARGLRCLDRLRRWRWLWLLLQDK